MRQSIISKIWHEIPVDGVVTNKITDLEKRICEAEDDLANAKQEKKDELIQLYGNFLRT